MQRLKIRLLRKTKEILLKANLLNIVPDSLQKSLLNLLYLTKLSKWIKETTPPEFNDFFVHDRVHSRRYNLYKYVIEKEKLGDICYLEFGVFEGASFKWWVNSNKSEESLFFGFDTFSGLPEKWGVFDKNEMSTNGNLPDINDGRARLIAGLFQDSLPKIVHEINWDKRVVIHLDADLYSSTLYVLTFLAPYFKSGDIIFFDEFNVPLHEFRAYLDFTSAYGVKLKIIGAVNNYYQSAFKVI